ncbi:hypothetical protein DC20_03975 [Rufibacter tibetensis]|uniref:Uncharacterized protein n=2 Tax=Rufibacter tibetensis TaxID=512763 RepID=A0A0N7HW54_9BACT|nr:hypothetical protein DC20_03975 [Rufibacter tibetensis]
MKPLFRKQIALSLLVTVVLCSCHNNEVRKDNSANNAQRVVALPESDSTNYSFKNDLKTIKESADTNSRKKLISIPKFEVEVRLSNAAEKKLKEDGETIIVGADFSGIPKDTSSDYYQHLGWIEVADVRKELKHSRLATFDNLKIPKAILDSLAEKDFEVNVFVISGRISSQNNILDSDFISTRISEIGGSRIIVKGKLIEELDVIDSITN